MTAPIQIISSGDFVKVNVSNSRNDSVAFETKFAKNITIAQLKKKLEIITGGNAGSMKIELYHGDRLLSKFDDDEALLGSFPIDDGARLHVIDNFSWIADDEVEKFELTKEQYESKSDTVRNFLRQNRLGKYNDKEMRQKEEKMLQQIEEEKQRAEACTVGARCQVKLTGHPIRRGTVKYQGLLEGKKGVFVGIKYDEPLGKNDGSIGGKRYFECAQNYGGFVSPMAVEVGDFPEEDFNLDDEI